MAFPQISYKDFLALPDYQRDALVAQNRIVNTDSYNRTMGHIKGADWIRPETYVLQMRKAHAGYIVAYGLRDRLQRILGEPISMAELEFAREFYEQSSTLPYFNYQGWKDVLLDNDGRLPLEIDAVADGTALLAGDPVLRVTGPGEIAAHFEPDLHRVFYPSLVATSAHRIAQTIGPTRFVEFGKRSAINEVAHITAIKAMYAGGGIRGTSNDAAVAAYPDELTDVGTVGHRLVQFYDTEREAFEQAVKATEAVALLVDLTDSYRGIVWAMDMKVKYRSTGKKIWLRLDSGDIREQAVFALNKFRDNGFDDPALDKLIVEDVSTEEEVFAIDRLLRQNGFDVESHVVYGAGGLLIARNKMRSDASSGYKLSARMEDDGRWTPKCKFSDSPGKESLPGRPVLGFKPGSNPQTDGRIIYQEGEGIGEVESLFVPAYRNGKLLLPEGLEAPRKTVERTFSQIQGLIGLQTRKSPVTRAMVDALGEAYDFRR